MLVAAGQRGQSHHELSAACNPRDRTVPPHPSQPQQGGRDRQRRIVVLAGPVEIVQDRPGVLTDQRFVMRREQHRHAAVGQRMRGHYATSGRETITCALVPAMPNAEVAAIRCPPTAGHGVKLLARRKPWLSQSISWLASVVCKVGGTAPCSAATRTLASPSAPLAAKA